MDQITWPNWRGLARSDGLRIEQVADGSWIVTPAGKLSVQYCPCCKRSIETSHAARLIADGWYPLSD